MPNKLCCKFTQLCLWKRTLRCFPDLAWAVQASLEAKTKSAKRAEQAALQKAEHAQHDLAVARRECERAAGDAEDRKVQLSVLVETVETLQAGTPGTASGHFVCTKVISHGMKRNCNDGPSSHCNTNNVLVLTACTGRYTFVSAEQSFLSISILSVDVACTNSHLRQHHKSLVLVHS